MHPYAAGKDPFAIGKAIRGDDSALCRSRGGDVVLRFLSSRVSQKLDPGSKALPG
jgi:hypothetical protein